MKLIIKFFTVAIITVLFTTSCAPLLVGGATVSGLSVFTDPRTAGAQLEDKSIYTKAKKAIYKKFKRKVHVSITSYDREVLLTGFVPSESVRKEVIAIVKGIKNVDKVYDELKINNNTSRWNSVKDATLTSKIRTKLIKTKHLSSNYFKITSNDSTVYVMGVTSARQKEMALKTIREIKGVKEVVSYVKVKNI